MNFRYRYVAYGTPFTAADGERSCRADEPAKLYTNELAVDVGGTTWGYRGEPLAVIDHHFFRTDRGQFPSACAAVLHNARRISERFATPTGDFWLVSHRQPDFDAFSSMYLARCLLLGEIPGEGWEALGLTNDGWFGGREEINWYHPDLRAIAQERHWAILLAAYASSVDQCRRSACPKERALHSILYAAMLRGRNYESEASGATEFFDEVRGALVTKHLHPLYDSVLEETKSFVPELRLLDGERFKYERDIGRARRAIVFVQCTHTHFPEWFDKLAPTPLFTQANTIDPIHLHPPGHAYKQVDGIFLRDPESLLFKEWARTDTEHSSMGRGFVFTAVAYSDGRRGAPFNTTDYYFALDPERADQDGMHLYNIWARLQAKEIETLHTPDYASTRAAWQDQAKPPRKEFTQRAEGPSQAFFFDPWFDGQNFKCTIVATPNAGTVIAPGAASDLSDDSVAVTVQEELESAIFKSPFEVVSYSASAGGPGPRRETFPPFALPHSRDSRPRQRDVAQDIESYRFCRVCLDDGVSLQEGGISEQVSHMLWRILHPKAAAAPPLDFAERHLLKTADWVGVWSVRGIAVAYKQDAEENIASSAQLFAKLVGLAQGLEKLTKAVNEANKRSSSATDSRPASGDDVEDGGLARGERYKSVLELGERLTQEVGVAKLALALPDNRLGSRFLEAGPLHEVLRTLREVYLAAVNHAQTATMNLQLHEVGEMQSKLEWLEVFIVGVYGVDLGYHVGDAFGFDHIFMGLWLLALASVIPATLIWLLRPYRHKGVTLGRLGIAGFVIMLLFAFYIAGGWIGRSKRGAGSETQTPQAPQGAGQEPEGANH